MSRKPRTPSQSSAAGKPVSIAHRAAGVATGLLRNPLHLLLRFKPENLLLLVFVTILVGIHRHYGGQLTPDKMTAQVPLVTMAALVVISLAVRGRTLFSPVAAARRAVLRDAGLMITDWLPFIFCVLVYENLHDTVKLIHPETLDGVLAWMDEWLFGVQPTVWLQRITVPWFTDFLAFAYSTYFFTPTIIGGLLYYRRRFYEFREMMFATITTFYMGYLGYVLVPAIGPRHYLRYLYDDPQHLQGIFIYDTTSALLDNLQAVNRDCFPSLHTGISTITLIYAWRMRDRLPFGRLIFWIYLPLTISLWFSTVYLRYHWVVDVFAGWALAALVGVFAPVVAGWWNEQRARLGLPLLGARD